MKKCKTGPCEKELSDKSKHERCSNCRKRLDYWAEKPPWRRQKRIEALKVAQARMAIIMGIGSKR